MKIKMTFTIQEKELQAGLVYDLPEDEAQGYVINQQAIPFIEEKAEPVEKKAPAPKKGGK